MSESQIAELLRKGIAAAKAGSNAEAQSLLMQVVELDEQNEQAWLWLSGLVESMDDRRTCLENVLAINPTNAHALAGLRWLTQQQPEPVAEPPAEPEPVIAQELCLRCQSPLPASAAECPTCGQILLVSCPACRQYVEIEQTSCPACGQALGDLKQGAAYYLGLANAYVANRRTEQALQALTWAEAEAGEDAHSLEQVAVLYEKLGRAESAVATYEYALTLAPNNPTISTRLGALYHGQGQRDKAQTMYEQALKFGGRNALTLTELARLQIERGGATKETIRMLGQAVKLDPKYAPAYLVLSDAYASLGDARQAARQVELACGMTSPDSQLGLEARRKLSELQYAPPRQSQTTEASAVPSGPQDLRKRPGCLSLYAILLGLLGFIIVLVGAFLAILAAIQGDLIQDVLGRVGSAGLPLGIVSLWGGVGFTVLAGVVSMAIAMGLWGLKNWARILTIILQAFGLFTSLIQAFFAVGGTRVLTSGLAEASFSLPVLIGLLVGFVIQTYILFWFVVNADLFN